MAAVAAPDSELTIDELARRTGMTARNIRAHQSRGLLPPPELRARTGYYGRDHVARLQLIRELQADGLNLRAIERMLDFGRAALRSFEDEAPEVLTVAELSARLGGPFDAAAARQAQRIGFVRPLPGGRLEVPSPTLLRAGEQLIALGVPVARALEVAEQIRRHARAIARAYVRLFIEEVAGDLGAAERSPEDWTRMGDALQRLRPLAAAAVQAAFAQAMSEAVERQLERSLQR